MRTVRCQRSSMLPRVHACLTTGSPCFAAWISVYQIFWGLLTFWTVFIPPFVAPHPPLSFDDLPTFVSNANKCFFGESVQIASNTTSFRDTCLSGPGNEWDTSEGVCTVDCDVAGKPITVFCVYIIFNLYVFALCAAQGGVFPYPCCGRW